MALHLLLVEDVQDLGRSGEVVRVKPGFARNFLLPQGVAVIADKNALRMQERLKEARKVQAIKDKSESEELAKRFEGLVLSTTVKVDQEGHMYGSVSINDVLHLINESLKTELEKKMVQLKAPIRSIGIYTIDLRLKEGVVASFTLKVMTEAGETEVKKKKSEIRQEEAAAE